MNIFKWFTKESKHDKHEFTKECKHEFTKYAVGYQALNSDGIAYDFQCEKCLEIHHVNLAYGVDLKELVKDSQKLEILADYISKHGFKTSSEKLMFQVEAETSG